MAHDVVTLYKGDDDLEAAVAKARGLVAKIDARSAVSGVIRADALRLLSEPERERGFGPSSR